MFNEGLNNVKVDSNPEVYALGANKVLMEGDYEDRHFAIIRHYLGFPDAYVEIKEDDYIYQASCGDGEQYELYQGGVHGGATFYDRCYWNKEDTRWYLGWDYGHLGDHQEVTGSWDLPGDNGSTGGRKWTIAEILMHIAGVIADIRWQNAEHWKELHALPEESDGT